MQTRNRFFDDAARLAGGAVGTFAGIRREMESLARQQFERLLSSMDLVTREEFDAVREMAVKARTGQEALEIRLAALEGEAKVGPKVSGAKRVRKKPATPKTSKKTG
ncbi:MAG: accessory factor UbiK family protein [Rhodospirillaceae bacterium]|jgi:BMFP domain-containing protein YqiC|nr:accessory factor UbiK family protein [Rhodospirillaceae bacterium]